MAFPLMPVKLFLIVLLAGTSLAAAPNELLYPIKSIERHLQILPGFWKGEAIETPVGPMNYDMVFHTCSDGTIAGVAKTGASLHYWQFKPNQGDLRLRFLSTFRGNRNPVLLLPRVSEGETLKFYAPKLKILTLDITFSKTRIDIRIFHHDKPHVHIRLTQTNDRPTELSPHHTLPNSCRGYPIRVPD